MASEDKAKGVSEMIEDYYWIIAIIIICKSKKIVDLVHAFQNH